jgi:ribose-phosphate pyrophosphokinase
VIDNVKVVNNHSFIKDVIDEIDERVVLISPDAGSNKKIYDLSKSLGCLPVVRCDKLRDVSNGKIIDSVIYAENLEGKPCLIVDDICSYGGTFCGLASKLKEHGAGKVYLAVSHYEGVASIQKLQSCGIDGVFTTDSKAWFDKDYTSDKFLKTFSIDNYL